MSKIIKLTSENVKRLQAVEITPTGNVIIIGGKNGAGKSSVLDSIEYALGGDTPDKMPVRRGEEKARIVVDLGELIVKRTFTAAGGTSLIVTNRDGAKQSSPQAILDKLVGKLTFDPLTFARQKPLEQAETLRKLVGLNFTEHDAKHQALYDDRTNVNRDVKALQARLAAMPEHDEAPKEEVSAADVMAEQGRAARVNQENAEKRQQAKALGEAAKRNESECLNIGNEITRLKSEIRLLEDRLKKTQVREEAAKIDLNGAINRADAAQQAADKLADVDLSPFQSRVTQVEADNRKVRENKAKAEARTKFQAKSKEADELTKKIEALDSERKRKTTAAKYPIDGLLFDTAGGVTLSGIPFDQCSAAEQLRISVAIGLALNPALKILLIRDGSLLDSDSMKLLAEMAEKADAQVWLEVVSPDAQTSIIIEDGKVKEPEMLL